VQVSHHLVDVGYTKRNIKGEGGTSLQCFELYQYYSKNGAISPKPIQNHVTEFLRYNLYGTIK
jgi:hypothetical protein